MKQNYSLLIVGYHASLLQLAPVIKHLKDENPEAMISLMTNLLENVPEVIKKNVVEILPIYTYSERARNPIIRTWFGKAFFLFSFVKLIFRRYDIINIHFAKPWLFYAIPCLRRMTKNVVITPWGSDVLRLEGEKNKKKLQKVYESAHFVTVSSGSKLGKAIIEKFACDPSKFHPLKFGMDFVDYLKEVKPNKTTEQAKDRFGLLGKYVITCGYSTARSHQHKMIIEAVFSIKQYLPDNIVLLFPFTYGWGGNDYVQSIKDKCTELGLKAVFVETFLSDADLYLLRKSTDMFVNVQTTDAEAASVMQYILCKKKIVSGTWLKYTAMEKYSPLFYFPVHDLKELGSVILDAFNAEEIHVSQGLIDYIMARGWKQVIVKWNEFFMSLK